MIELLLSMMRARRGRAMFTFILAAMAAAAAAAGPLYQGAAADSLRSVVVQSEPASHSALTAAVFVGQDAPPADPSNAPEPPHIAGATTVTGAWVGGMVEGRGGSEKASAVWRSGACDHLSIVAGRCATSDREVVLREDTARRIGAKPGQDIALVIPPQPGYDGADTVQRLTVVGVCARLALHDAFWAGRSELLGSDAVVFTTERTLATLGSSRVVTVDFVMSPAAFADLGRLRDEIPSVGAELGGAGFELNAEGVESLMDRIATGQQQLGASLVPAVAPLVLLCWLVLFITVGSGMESRRSELGLTGLRGLTAPTRWLLATGESAVPVLLALVPGYLLAYVMTVWLAHAAMPGDPRVEMSFASFAGAALAVVGALVVCMLAQVRDLTAPVTKLLRAARTKRAGRGAGVVEVIVGTLALVAGYQAVAGGSAQGVGLLAPLCFSLGLGLLAARVFGAPMDRYGRRALFRGRLRPALAAFSVARGAGAQRIVVLLVVSIGLLGFALSAVNVAGRAWDDRASVGNGAARVLGVQPVPASALLRAVRSADPGGRYAMAVVGSDTAAEGRVLAVDSTRLSAVALWPAAYGSTGAAEVGRLLRPQPTTPLELKADELLVTVTFATTEAGSHPSLALDLIRPSGPDSLRLETSDLLPGTHTYRLATPACADAPCILADAEVDIVEADAYRFDVTVGDILDGDGKPLITAQQMSGQTWRAQPASTTASAAELRPAEGGVDIHVDTDVKPDIRVYPDSAPRELPVVTAGHLREEEALSDGDDPLAVAKARSLTQVPRYGAKGMLVDLEYLAMRTDPAFTTDHMEVWLAASAPSGIIDKLTAAGLVVTDDRSTADLRTYYSQDSPALALWFLLLASICGIGLAAAGLVATSAFDREGEKRGLAVLQPQGLPASVVRSASLWGRWALVLMSAVVGLAAAALSWFLARASVPVFGGGLSAVAIPAVPDPLAVLLPTAVAVLALLAVCVVTTRRAPRGREKESK